MRISVITWYFPTKEETYRGRSAYETLKKLRDFAEIEVLCPQPQYPSWLGPKSFRNHASDLTYTIPELRVRYFGYPVVPLVSRPFNSLVCTRALAPMVAASKPDILLNYKVYPEGHAAVSLGRKFRLPVVVTSIGSDLNRIPDPITKALTLSTIRGATMVTTVSDHLRQRAISLGVAPDRARAILNGCDATIFHNKNQADARRRLDIASDKSWIVFIGRIDEQKGVVELAEAFGRLAQQKPQLHMALVGEGPAEDKVKAIAASCGCLERIRFASPCPSEEVALWMAAADLVTLPSYAEGCPNVVVEALNCGRPVVATLVGGIPELVHDNNGVLVPPRDASALAQALESVLERPWDHEAISRSSARGWEQVAKETYQACEQAIALYQAGKTSGS